MKNFLYLKFFKSNAITALLFLIIPVLSIVHWSKIYDDTLLPRFILLSFVVMVMYITIGKVNILDTAIYREKIFMLFLLFFGVNVFSSAFSENKAEGLIPVALIITNFLLLLILTDLFSTETQFFKIITKSITITIILHGVIMASEIYTDSIDFTSYKSLCQLTSLMGNKNLFAEYMAVCLPFAVYGSVYNKRTWKMLSLTATLICMLSVVLLQTRSAWSGVFMTSIAAIVLVAIRERKNKKPVKGIKPLFFCVLIILVITGSSGSLRESLQKRIASVFEINKNGSASGRLYLWKKSVQVWKQNPVIGVGPGNWKTEYQKHVVHPVTNVFNVRPMNDYVQILCETGLLGFVVYIFIIALVMVHTVKKFLFNRDSETAVFSLVVLCSFITFLTCSFFSYPKERPEHSVLFIILLSASVVIKIKRNYYTVRLIGKPFSWVDKILPVSLFIVILFIAALRLKGEYFIARALKAKSNHHQMAVIENTNRAETIFYRMDETTTPVSWYRGVAKFMINDPTALKDFQAAYRYNPSHIDVLNNLATSLDRAGRHDEAEFYYRKALTFSPGFTDVIANLTIVLINKGKYTEAKKVLTTWRSRKNATYYMLQDIVKKNLNDTSRWKN